MAHIAFFAPPGAGHVYPTLGVVAELVARGHRISYATGARFTASLAEVGAERVGYRSTLETAFAAPPQFTGNDLVIAMHAALHETETVLPELSRAVDDDPPDLIVCDGAAVTWVARLLAARLSVPVVQTWPNLVSNEHWSLGRTYTRVNPAHPRFWTFVLRLHRLVRRHGSGLTVRDLTDNKGVAAKLVFLPRAFQFAGDTFDETHHFVGPCLGDRSFQGTWRPAATDRPVVLVSLGTGYNRRPEFFRACVDAFADAPWRVVMAVGDHVRRSDLGPLPPRVEVHASVPQLDVLRHAALFVTHAGMGSVMEALHNGVPMVAVPQMAEQRANADRIAALGLGVRMDPADVTAARLRAAVEAVIDDADVRRAVDGMRRTIEESGGTKVAADVVEAALPR